MDWKRRWGVPRQSSAESTTLVSRTIRTADPVAPCCAHRLHLGLDLLLREARRTGSLERRRDRQQPVERVQAARLAGKEVYEILDLGDALLGQRLDLLHQGFCVGGHRGLLLKRTVPTSIAQMPR